MFHKAEEFVIHNKRWSSNDPLYIPYPNCKRQSCLAEVTCIGCLHLFCSGCHVIPHSDTLSSFICNGCCSKQEFKDILVSIEIALNESAQIRIGRKLCHIIAAYSTGLVVNCCNYLACDKEIYFKNKYEFDRFMDIDYNTTYHYSIDNAQKRQNNMIYIYGKYRRVFCFECTNRTLIRCKYLLCKIKDVTFNKYRMCGNHLRCELCHCPVLSDYQLTKCKNCGKYICNKCNYRNKPNNVCPPCYKKSKKQQLFILLECCLGDELDVDIIRMLTDFYIGGAVKCGNKYDCDNDICIGNRHNLENMIDVDGNQIYWYRAREEARGNAESLYIYHYPMIIFCSYCTAYKLNRCEYEMYIRKVWKWQHGMWLRPEKTYYKCCNKEASFSICQFHPVCCVCNSPQQYKREYAFCIKENCQQYICNECASNNSVCTKCRGKCEKLVNDTLHQRKNIPSWTDIGYYDDYDVVLNALEWNVDYMAGINRKSRGYVKEEIKYNNRYKGGNYGYKARKKKKRESHYKHENDKKNNIKNKRYFYKKFMLSLQY